MLSRMLASIFLCLTVMILGAEMLKFLEGSEQGWISISQIINFGGGLEQVNGETIDSPDRWQNFLSFFLNFPAVVVFMGISVLLFFKNR